MQVKKKNNSDISERIKFLIEKTGNNTNSFAKKLGYERSQAIYDILNGKAMPSFDFFKRLKNSEYHDISVDYLITGDAEYSATIVSDPVSKYETKKGVPIIPYSAVAGRSGFSISVLNEDIKHYLVIPMLKEKGDFAFEVDGDSMSPGIPEGSFVVCKKINQEDLKYEKPYLITVDHSPMIKRLLPGDDNSLLCRSDNSNHRDFTVRKTSITSVAKILCVIII